MVVTQYSCIIMDGKVTSCSTCKQAYFCTVNALVQDLSATRVHCPNCHRETKEEHVRYCPFCGYYVLDLPMDNGEVAPRPNSDLARA